MPTSVLAQRDFRLILAAWGVSMVGDFLAVVALTLRVQEATGSGWAVSGLLLAFALPVALLNPLAGWLVDRLETTRVLAATAGLQALAAIALALVESVPATIALAFLLACGLAVEGPAIFALLPRVVGEHRVAAANSQLEAVRYGGFTLGVLGGGVITGAFGAATALLLDAGTFAVTASAALALRTRRRPPSTSAAPGDGGALTAGLRVLAMDRVLRTSVLALGAALIFATLTNVAEVFYAKDELEAGDAGFGALVASWGAGMTLGALVIGRRLSAANAAHTVAAATAVTGASLALAAPAPALAFALVCFVVGGIANGTENVAMRVLIHARVPDRLRGRAFSAYHGGMSGVEFLALAAGGMAVELVGARGTMATAGLGALAAGLLARVVLARQVRAGRPDGPRRKNQPLKRV